MAAMFRRLRADEIECRVQSCTNKGAVLLLYKNARCDQNILDETVGAMNWQRRHRRDNANCIVSLWDEDKQQWISKEDTGTESNTEAEKGLASDSFKRACFNWGIGRELYTAPFIFIPAAACNITERNGRPTCYDRFKVIDIAYDEAGTITRLQIVNEKTGQVVFGMGTDIKEAPNTYKPKTKETASEAKKAFMAHYKKLGMTAKDAQEILERVGWTIDQGKATDDQYSKADMILDEYEVLT